MRPHALDDLHVWRERLQTIVEAVSDAVAIVDFSGAVTYVNGTACALLGVTPADVLGRPVESLTRNRLVLDERGAVLPDGGLPGPSLLQGEPAGEVLLRLVDAATGKERSAIVRATPLLDEHRRVAAMVMVLRDVTTEQHARLFSTRLQEVTSSLSRAVTVEDVANASCRAGIEAHGAVSGGLWRRQAGGALVLVASIGAPPDLVDDVAATGEPAWIETEVAFAALPLRVVDGVTGVIVFGHAPGHRFDADERAFYVNVSQQCAQALDRARLLDEARLAAEAARQASLAKDEFLAMLGHELRNPLAPIVTALQLMKLHGDDFFQKERAILDRQVRHLGRLVDDLLDVARITAGRIDLDRQPVDVAAMIAQAIEMVTPLIEERRHRLAVSTVAGLVVDGDADRLAQVVSNLLTNAARYTDPGGNLHVTARTRGDHVEIVVRDDGMGIPAALLPRLFEVFTQGSQPLDRRAGGLGLGLSIVRSLVGLHGGTVEARSDGPGRGTELHVRLPRGVSTGTPLGPAATPESPTPASRGHVLVVDDNVDAADLLEVSLTAFGFRTECAYDAAQALERMGRCPPQAAVLDIGLPGMDGLELARRIRATPELRDMRLVALTGYSQPSDRAQTREAGFDKHMVKPVDIYELDRTLAKLLEPR